MGLIDFFFGKKKQVHEVKLDSLSSWLDRFSKNEDISSELDEIEKKIDEEKELVHKNIKKLLDGKLMNPNTPERARHIMDGNRKTYAQKVEQFISDIKLPKDHQQILDFHDEIQERLDEFSKNTLRNYQILQEFLRDESSELAGNIKKIADYIEQAKGVVDGSAVQKTSLLKKDIDKIYDELSRKDNIKKNIHSEEKEVERLRDKLSDVETKREALENSKDNLDLKRLQNRHEEIKKELGEVEKEGFHYFSILKTAMKKYERIALDYKQVQKYLDDPLKALRDDEDLKIIDILSHLKKSVDEDKINLKDKKRYKIRGVIDKLDKKYLEDLRSRSIDIRKDLKEVEKDIKDNDIDKRFQELDDEIKHTKDAILEKENQLSEMRDELDKIDISSLKDELENDIQEKLDEEVKIDMG